MNIKKLLQGTIIGTLLLGISAVPAFAASFSNGGFESGPYYEGWFNTVFAVDSTTIPGWTVDSGNVDYIDGYWTSSEGLRSIDMTGFLPGIISQTIPTVVGHTYVVTFDLAGNPVGSPAVKTLQVQATGAAMQSYTFDVTGKTLTAMGWTPETYEFTATSVSTKVSFTSTDSGFFGPALDNVAITDILTNKNQCKNDGWMSFTNPAFKNQGDCVSYIQSNEHALANKIK